MIILSDKKPKKKMKLNIVPEGFEIPKEIEIDILEDESEGKKNKTEK